MTRGQDGSLDLSCVALASTTPRRFIPAHPDISPITCDHDDVFELPDSSREAGSLFTYPVTLLQDHCCDQASPHGHYRFPAALFRDGRTLRNQSGPAS